MAGVRPFEVEDVPRVAALRARVFEHCRLGSREAVERQFVRVFLENPWRRDDLPSLVYSTAKDPVAGFLGVVPRSFRIAGREIRAAVTGQFMVAPEARGLAGLALYDTLFRAPHDLVFTDIPNEPARMVWEALGAKSAFVYGLNWTLATRPLRYRAHRWGMSLPSRLARAAAWPVAGALDSLSARRLSGRYNELGVSMREDVSAEELCGLVEAMSSRKHLRPHYEPSSLAWLLQRARDKWGPDDFRTVVVDDADGTKLGWFVCVTPPGGVAHVIQIGAGMRKHAVILEALLAHVSAHGAIAVKGRFSRPFLDAVRMKGCSFTFDNKGILLYTTDSELSENILTGDAMLTGLDGEWWMGF